MTTSDLNLYDFPPDHVGRKSYVTVKGHTRSIPKYKCYMGVDSRWHLHPDFGGTWDGAGEVSAYVMPDKLAYVSPIDGSHVTSRSQHREHMNRHGVVEAGDMKPGSVKRHAPTAPRVTGHDIVRAIRQLGGN